jgi:2,3-bisphosphoglycerate-independent phosphoglycerate mutase
MTESGAILCIIDGLTDEGFRLERYPHLAAMKTAGAWGKFQTVPAGFPAESYPCIATLLGIPGPRLPRYARGYLEALGAGIAVAPGDLVLRGSWVRLDQEGRISGVASPPKAVPRFTDAAYYHLDDYKALLVLRGAADVLERITTYPPHAYAGSYLAGIIPQGDERLTGLVQQSRVEDRALIPWGQSASCSMPPFRPRAAAVGGTLIVQGLCRAVGMELHTGACFTGDTDTDLPAKRELALALARKHRFVFLHLNGADEASHRLDPHEKAGFLRQVDREVIAALKDAAGPVLVCADHGTSPVTGKHLGDPQPFLLHGHNLTGNLEMMPGTAAVKLLLEGVTWPDRS